MITCRFQPEGELSTRGWALRDYQRQFIELALARQALRFGEFTLKSGRVSPYFFNAGLFNDGASIATLGACYAASLAQAEFDFDMLFGPAYKGIALAATTAIALATRHGRNVPWAYNRKEAKDHGESGVLVGAPLKGRVVIIDDVITAGTAIRESIELIRRAGATPVAVAVALDRQERGLSDRSAVQEMISQYGLHCLAILTLSDLIAALESPGADLGMVPSGAQLEALRLYRQKYGLAAP
jgi:orotate phosphoribosyltransferase